jgi:hypothetical protein
MYSYERPAGERTPVRKISEKAARRLTAQLLSGTPATRPEAVVERLLAVQAQDPRGARLAIRSRTQGLTAADLDAALTDRRSLVVAWLNRGTLHLVTAADYWWLHPVTTPQIATTNLRRLEQEGVSPKQAARGVDVVRAAVAERPQTRAELRRRLEAARVPTAEQAFIHVVLAASLRGDLVRGPMIGGEHAFVSAADWLGPAPEPLERLDALARLARRYLAGHGPADAGDLARWAKLPLGDARAALAAIRGELTERLDGLVDLAATGEPAPAPAPRLLAPFDPLLLGWVDRAEVIGAHTSLVTTNGIFRPFALVDGRAVAVWRLAGNVLTLEPLERVSRATINTLRADAAGVFAFLGLPDARVVVADS